MRIFPEQVCRSFDSVSSGSATLSNSVGDAVSLIKFNFPPNFDRFNRNVNALPKLFYSSR